MPSTVIPQKLINLIVEQLGVPAQDVTPQARLISELGADSLDVIELANEIEQEFEIEVTDEEFEKVQTVQQLVELIEEKLGK